MNSSSVSAPFGIRVHRSLTSTLLFFFFVLAFVAAPYWLVPQSPAGRIVALLVTVFLGMLWTRLAAREIHAPLDRRSWIPAAILLVLTAALNFRALTSGIPWRGDEAYHIAFARSFTKLIPSSWLAMAIVAAAALFYVVWRRPRYAAAACAVLVAGCIAIFLLRQPPPLESILRYPFVSRWFHAAVPILFRPFIGLNQEIVYRIVPFLSAVMLSLLYARSIDSRNTVSILVLGLAAATVPSVYYYSSILYLEMPAAVLMFVVCREADELLTVDFDELTKMPAWYALVFIGFIKETAAAFLLMFVAFRMLVRARYAFRGVPWKRLVRDELFMAVSALLPLTVYLFYRTGFGNRRAFHFAPAEMLDPQLVFVVLRAHLEQFGLIYLFFLAGIVLLFRKGQARKALFLLAAVASTTLFHLIDGAIYAGYSRFNLFVLPAILAGSLAFLQFIGAWRRWLPPVLGVLVIAANLAMSPVNPDGSRKAFWGNYLPTSPMEHSYPYREALAWLEQHDPAAVIRFTGLHADFYFDFYFDKLNWHPRYEVVKETPAADPASIHEVLENAAESGADSVVVRLDGGTEELEKAGGIGGQWQLKVFRNMAHALLVYTK